MKKILTLAMMLLFSVSAYAQPNAKKNLYLIDANGNVLELASPSLSGNVSITMQTTSGALVTNNSSGGQTVTGGMTISGGATLTGGTSVGTSLTLTGGAYTRWYDPAGLRYTQIGAANGQAADRTYIWPIDAPAVGEVLAYGAS